MKERNPHALRGVACSALGGVCWGFSGTCGQYLFSRFGINSLWLTCIRLLAAGIVCVYLLLHDAAFRTYADSIVQQLYGYSVEDLLQQLGLTPSTGGIL